VRNEPDRLLLTLVLLVCAAGILVAGSSGSYVAMTNGSGPSSFMWRQLVRVLLGLAAISILQIVPISILESRRTINLAVGFQAVLLTLVLLAPGEHGHRWFRFSGASFQPSQFAGVVTVLFIAHTLSRDNDGSMSDVRVFLRCISIPLLFSWLILLGSDLGTTVILLFTSVTVFFVAGLPRRFLIYLGSGLAVCALAAVLIRPYNSSVVPPLLQPERSFALTQSLLACGSGQVLGVGIGQGLQKALFLPAANTDFVFSSICEETGAVGAGFVMLCFVGLLLRGARVARLATSSFELYLAFGLTILVVIQALLHISVVLGVVPTVGVPLPLLSFGGSSTLATMTAFGIVLRLSKQAADAPTPPDSTEPRQNSGTRDVELDDGK
jgi:cell division protein FtsW